MDPRFQVADPPRAVPPKVQAETPLVTLAWRALQAEHQARTDESWRTEQAARRLEEALACIAEEVHRLRRATRLPMPAAEAGKPAQALLAIADRLTEALAKVDVEVVAPEEQPYCAELMEMLENVAQRVVPEAREPRVAEVIAPAVIYRGALLRMGKAVIAVPGERG